MSPRSDLTLELHALRPRVPLGSEVPYRLVLRNGGASALDVVSLFDNNRVINIEIARLQLDADGREHAVPIGVVNHVTRQVLMGKVEVRTEDTRPLTLQAGGEEQREDNLCRYHWFETPGRYRLRALYQWQDIELWSEPVVVEIHEAPLQALDQQWSYHYGERFALQSVWVVPRDDGRFQVYQRQSLRFSPQVIDFNPALVTSPAVFRPRVSFDRSLLAGGDVWLAWEADGHLAAMRTSQGALAAGPFFFALPLQDVSFAGPPLTAGGDDLVVFLLGRGDADEHGPAGPRLLGIRIRGDGTEESRTILPAPLIPGDVEGDATIPEALGVGDPDGTHHLLWHVAPSGDVMQWSVDPQTLQAEGTPRRLHRSKNRILRVCAPPVFGDDAWLTVISVRAPTSEDRLDGVLELTWLGLDAAGNPLKGEELAYADARHVVEASGEMNDRGDLYALVTSRNRVLYVNGSTAATRSLMSTGDLFDPGLQRLTLTSRGDVFLAASKRPAGLHEVLVQSGIDDDIDALEDEEGEGA